MSYSSPAILLCRGSDVSGNRSDREFFCKFQSHVTGNVKQSRLTHKSCRSRILSPRLKQKLIDFIYQTRQIMWKIGLLSLTLIGCTNAQKLTAGLIGCPANEIEISDHDRGMFQGAWTAKCRGKTFYCSATSTDGGVHGDCKEGLK